MGDSCSVSRPDQPAAAAVDSARANDAPARNTSHGAAAAGLQDIGGLCSCARAVDASREQTPGALKIEQKTQKLDELDPEQAKARMMGRMATMATTADSIMQSKGCTSLTKHELRPFQITVSTIWKYATRSTENLLKHKLEKEIQSKISEMTSLASFKFTKCQFGESVPEILHISTRGRGDTMQYVLDLKWDAADAQIAVQVGALSAGLKGIHVRCAVLVGLAPLVPVVPVVGGISITFPDPPDLRWTWTGAASAFPSKVLRKAIEDALCDLIVVPYQIFSNVLDTVPDQSGLPRDLSMETYSSPAPLGVLRVELVEAWDLHPADMNGLSDPYVTIKIGRGSYKSRVVFKNLNPKWPEFSGADFMIFNMEQKVKISVYDSDAITADDHLGSVYMPSDLPEHRPCPTVAEMMEFGSSWWPLDITDPSYRDKHRSQLRVHCKFFQLRPQDKVTNVKISPVMMDCPSRCGMKQTLNGDCSLCGKGSSRFGCGGSRGKSCRNCRFSVCAECLVTERPACSLLQITLFSALVPESHAESGQIMTLEFEGVRLKSLPSLPEWGLEAWQIEKADAVTNLHTMGGLSPRVIAKCLNSTQAEIQWRCAQKSAASQLDSPQMGRRTTYRQVNSSAIKPMQGVRKVMWNHNFYFLVKDPSLSEAKVKVKYEDGVLRKTTLTNELGLGEVCRSSSDRGAVGFDERKTWILQGGKGGTQDVKLKLNVRHCPLTNNLMEGSRDADAEQVYPVRLRDRGSVRSTSTTCRPRRASLASNLGLQ